MKLQLIPNSPGWLISQHGEIFNAAGRLMKTQVASGYAVIKIPLSETNKQRKIRLVHRLVWESWIGQIPEGYWINHKDGNKLNNNLENLECDTPKHNHEHARDVLKRKYTSGDNHGMTKLDHRAREAVLALRSAGWSLNRISEALLVSYPTIQRLCTK